MKRKKTNNEHLEKTSIVSVSLIVFLLDKLSGAIYNALINGWFGKIFTSYSKEQRSFEEGFLKDHFTSGIRIRHFFRWIRQHLSRSFEGSFFLKKLRAYSYDVLATPLKSFGHLFFSFGIYTILVYALKLFIPGLPESDISTLIVGLSVCIVAIPMLISSDNLAIAISKGSMTKSIVMESLGFREESFDVKTKTTRTRSNVMILIGMLLGIFTVFIDPLTLLLGIGAIVGIVLIFASPEIGILVALFALPFFSFFESPTKTIGMLITITSISYFVKIIRGKRIFKLEIMDLSVLAFMLLIYFSGAIGAGGHDGYQEVLVSCTLLFGYFLVVNLMRNERWLRRCILALVSSGTIVAFIGVLQYFMGVFQTGAWLDTDYFSDIKGRTVSLFENPNVLAAYLVMVLPFALLLLTKSNNRRERLLYNISTLAILLCIVFTWSRGAWLATIAVLLVFSMIYSRKTLRYLFMSCFAIPLLPIVLPQSVIGRFASIGDMSDSSTLYRVYTWKGTWNAIKENFWSGVGYGNSAYAEIYPRFAYAGIEAAEHSHNLYLQILFGLGIGGLIIFAIVMLLYFQMNLEHIRHTKDRGAILMIAASICGVIGMLVMGMFDFVWYNYRVFFLFWVVMGLACACTRIGNEEERRHGFLRVDGLSSAITDLNM